MRTIFNQLNEKLGSEMYIRQDPNQVDIIIKQLGVEPSEFFCDFFKKYEGPFWEETIGFELLDVIEDNENIYSNTILCRSEFNFPTEMLVLSKMSTNQIIVFDTLNNKVYRVNFEGEDELLKENELEAEWDSFESFLKEYFELS